VSGNKRATIKLHNRYDYTIGMIQRPKIKKMFKAFCANTNEICIRGGSGGMGEHLFLYDIMYYIYIYKLLLYIY
jgi:hypothetical protein